MGQDRSMKSAAILEASILARFDRRQVMIVPCGGSKVDSTVAARDLYTGSAFGEVLAAAICEVGEENVMILSAEHGLLELDALVAPYDTKMGDADAIDRRDGGLLDLAAQILSYGLDEADVFAMVPKKYLAILDEAMRFAADRPVAPVYEDLLGIGEQKAVAKILRNR